MPSVKMETMHKVGESLKSLWTFSKNYNAWRSTKAKMISSWQKFNSCAIKLWNMCVAMRSGKRKNNNINAKGKQSERVIQECNVMFLFAFCFNFWLFCLCNWRCMEIDLTASGSILAGFLPRHHMHYCICP